MKKLFFMIGCLLGLGSAPVVAVGQVPTVVVVQLIEFSAGARVIIARGDAKPEVQEFRRDREGTITSGYQQAIAKLYQQGYVLQGPLIGTVATSEGGGRVDNTLLFIKSRPK